MRNEELRNERIAKSHFFKEDTSKVCLSGIGNTMILLIENTLH
jgi:hypothetical protein